MILLLKLLSFVLQDVMPLPTEDANQDGYFVGPTIFAEVKRGMQIYVPRYHQNTVDETGQVCCFQPSQSGGRIGQPETEIHRF